MMNNDLSFPTEKIVQVARKEKPALIVLVSPNSPTGQSLPVADVEQILNDTEAIVLVDEAYIEFSEKQSVQVLLAKFDRLIVLRTFSKAFSMAGLRVGYLLAAPSLCVELLKPKIPFTVNAFSAAVAMKLIKRKEIIDERIALIKYQKNDLLKSLRTIVGVESFSSDTNFLIFKTPRPARELFDRLLDHNVLIRDVSSYPLLARTLRVNAGTEEENRIFLSVLQKTL
jgi:histidinol-phosphate aminotransferase